LLRFAAALCASSALAELEHLVTGLAWVIHAPDVRCLEAGHRRKARHHDLIRDCNRLGSRTAKDEQGKQLRPFDVDLSRRV